MQLQVSEESKEAEAMTQQKESNTVKIKVWYRTCGSTRGKPKWKSRVYFNESEALEACASASHCDMCRLEEEVVEAVRA
jgi:hypothetical protein